MRRRSVAPRLRLAIVVAALALAACGSASSPPDTGGVPPSGTPGAPTNPPSSGGDTTPPAKVKVSNETVQVQSRARTFVLVVPTAYDTSKKYPLVLAFHGQPGDGKGFRQFSNFEAASQDDAIVAYPDGLDGEWDLSLGGGNVDVPFVEAIVDAVGGKYNVDKSRVFGTGYSNGGFFLSIAACNKSGLFRALSIHAGGAPFDQPEHNPQYDDQGFLKCPQGGGGPVATIVFHGDKDTVVEPDSGDYAARYWAHANGCEDSRSAASPAPCVKHDGCPADKPTLYCFIPNLSHVVWKDGPKVSWDFFKAL